MSKELLYICVFPEANPILQSCDIFTLNNKNVIVRMPFWTGTVGAA